MSDLWIAAKPRIDEPSNMAPSVKKSSGSVAAGTLKCCCWPGRSVKRTSMNSTPSFLMKLRTSSGLVNIRSSVNSMGVANARHTRLPAWYPECFRDVSQPTRRVPGSARTTAVSVSRSCRPRPSRSKTTAGTSSKQRGAQQRAPRVDCARRGRPGSPAGRTGTCPSVRPATSMPTHVVERERDQAPASPGSRSAKRAAVAADGQPRRPAADERGQSTTNATSRGPVVRRASQRARPARQAELLAAVGLGASSAGHGFRTGGAPCAGRCASSRPAASGPGAAAARAPPSAASRFSSAPTSLLGQVGRAA